MYEYKEKYKKYTIDFSNVNHYLEMHAVIWHALDFPDYYGCNWSAFWDCLKDMLWRPIHIEIIGLEVIEEKFDGAAEKMIEILRELKHFCNDSFYDTVKIEVLRTGQRIEIE